MISALYFHWLAGFLATDLDVAIKEFCNLDYDGLRTVGSYQDFD